MSNLLTRLEEVAKNHREPSDHWGIQGDLIAAYNALPKLLEVVRVQGEALRACSFSMNHLTKYKLAVAEAIGMGEYDSFVKYQWKADVALKRVEELMEVDDDTTPTSN